MFCCCFFFPFSVVLAAQNVSASLVTDDRFKTAQNGVTDPPYSLTCLEQGKTPPHSHISTENLWCWGEANCRLISNYTNCTVFRAQYNEFFLSFLQTWIKYLILNGKVKNKLGFVSRQWINMSCSLTGKGGAGIFTCGLYQTHMAISRCRDWEWACICQGWPFFYSVSCQFTLISKSPGAGSKKNLPIQRNPIINIRPTWAVLLIALLKQEESFVCTQTSEPLSCSWDGKSFLQWQVASWLPLEAQEELHPKRAVKCQNRILCLMIGA